MRPLERLFGSWSDRSRKRRLLQAGDAEARAIVERAMADPTPAALADLTALAGTGRADAQVALGRLYETGRGVLRNLADAAAWYRRAAGDPVAEVRLATLLLIGAKAPPPPGALGSLFPNGAGIEPDPVEARALAVASARGGNTEGQALAGYLHAAGIGGLVDMTAAETHYRPAAEAGNPEAALGLATLLAGGHVGAADPSAARPWFAKAAAAGNPTAQTSLALDLLQGSGGPRDPAEAVRLLESASAAGHAPALRLLGLLHLEGGPVAQDRVKAETCLRTAAGLGDPDAAAKLGDILADVADHEAAEWYRTAADRGHRSSMRRLAEFYKRGRGVPTDPVQAMTWLKRAAERGDPDAQFTLGVAYAVGDGVDRDFVSAAFWSKAAAEAGHRSAKVNIGRFRMQGIGGPRDPAEALRWLRTAMDDGERAAVVALGELLAFWSDPPEIARARELFRRGVEQGDQRAADLLARLDRIESERST